MCSPTTTSNALYSNLQKNTGSPPPGFGGGNWWYYDVSLVNTGNVGITITNFQKCYEYMQGASWISLSCDPIVTDFSGIFNINYISPGTTINSLIQNYVWFTAGYTYRVTGKFNLQDDHNNNLVNNYIFTVVS